MALLISNQGPDSYTTLWDVTPRASRIRYAAAKDTVVLRMLATLPAL
jgi:hypothetical protein